MKVLLAEDDFITRVIVEKHLRWWGYDVLVAEKGEDAWQMLQKDEVCLAILDWMMPEMEGVELCRRIRKKESPHYKYIILLTSKTIQEDVNRGLAAGADDYMTKPFDPLELRLRLQTGKRIISLEDKLLEAQRKLICLATQDHLTSLLNRAAIHKHIKNELSRNVREKTFTGIIMVDIDYFKRINDTHGHDIGDSVLIEVASRLKDTVRPYDNIGRYGGDEMLVVLSNCDIAQVEKAAHRIHFSISRKKIKTKRGLLGVTISVGGASSEIFPQVSPEDLIRASDRALYAAKNRGRNQYVIVESLGFFT